MGHLCKSGIRWLWHPDSPWFPYREIPDSPVVLQVFGEQYPYSLVANRGPLACEGRCGFLLIVWQARI